MTQTVPPPLTSEDLGEEALFPEARRLRRRRWAIRGGIVASACLIAGLVFAIFSGRASDSHRAARFVAGAPPAGALTMLHLAGALAVARDGELYVADVPQDRASFGALNADRVLVRLSDGRFRVVVANVPDISGLAFAPDGTLYIADAGWVRQVSRNGLTRTIAGDGRPQRRNPSTNAPLGIPAGTRALSAPLGSIHSVARTGNPLHIAFDPGGRLYISTGTQILRLTAQGTLEPVRANVTPAHGLPGGQLRGFGPIAVASNGTFYVGGGLWGWSLWAVSPDGTAHYLGFARQSGGNYVDVHPGPDGTVYAANGDGIRLIEHGKPRTVFEFSHKIASEYFSLTNFAIDPNGVIYADEIPRAYGFEEHQQLVAEHNRNVTLLWQENNRVPR